jgi:type I restriction enzyme S subunit
VNNRDGVFLNEFRLGVEFNQNQKHIEKDWFFHNPTRANVGSIGRVLEVEANAITSPEYQVWKLLPDSKFSADFMEIVIRTPMFLDQVKIHRVGAVKERLYVDNLREILVPIIDDLEQSEIVAEVRAAYLALHEARIELKNAQKRSSQKIGRHVRST